MAEPASALAKLARPDLRVTPDPPLLTPREFTLTTFEKHRSTVQWPTSWRSTRMRNVRVRLPGARYVKGLNTLTVGFLAESSKPTDSDRVIVFLSSDDDEAKRVAATVVRDAGFEPVDLGRVADSAPSTRRRLLRRGVSPRRRAVLPAL
jgi:predicted dinucleotide-binding enzyme